MHPASLQVSFIHTATDFTLKACSSPLQKVQYWKMLVRVGSGEDTFCIAAGEEGTVVWMGKVMGGCADVTNGIGQLMKGTEGYDW